MPKVVVDQEEYFWSRVDRGGPGECWLWTKSQRKRYGNFYGHQAHRWIFERLNGPVPESMVVRHTCDVPKCVNPSHLLVGTQLDNIRDMESRGRRRPPRPEMARTAKLDRSRVEEIRRLYVEGGVSQAELGRRYGVSDRNVSLIVRGLTWR